MTYWQLQLQTVTALATMGIQWQAIQRLELFKMRQRLLREFPNHQNLDDTLFLLDELTRMRQLGLEPKHNGKLYV